MIKDWRQTFKSKTLKSSAHLDLFVLKNSRSTFNLKPGLEFRCGIVLEVLEPSESWIFICLKP